MSASGVVVGSGSRVRALALYRSLLRAAAALPSHNHRGQARTQTRHAFRQNAGLREEAAVEEALALADTQLENLRLQGEHLRRIVREREARGAGHTTKVTLAPHAATTLGQARRAFHSSSARAFSAAAASPAATPTAASAAAFWAAGVDPAAAAAATATPTAPLGMPQPLEGLAGGGGLAGAPLVATHIVHVRLSANNTIVTLTTPQGDTKAWASSGTCGFKNAKKSTYMACIACGEQLGAKARNQNIRAVDMHISGFHKNKKAVLKGLMKAGLNVVAIRDTTPIPFNGCKPKKQRRL